MAAARHLDVSGHCSPYQHAPVLAAIPNLRHLEYFHDHVRIEQLLFAGALPPSEGLLALHDTPGNGTAFVPERAAAFLVRS